MKWIKTFETFGGYALPTTSMDVLLEYNLCKDCNALYRVYSQNIQFVNTVVQKIYHKLQKKNIIMNYKIELMIQKNGKIFLKTEKIQEILLLI